MAAETRIAVFGAGAIGCWVGGRLASGGADVTLIGRQRVMDELANGLHVTDLHGDEAMVRPQVATEAAAAASADATLVTVKSAQTSEAVIRKRVSRGLASLRRKLKEPTP